MKNGATAPESAGHGRPADKNNTGAGFSRYRGAPAGGRRGRGAGRQTDAAWGTGASGVMGTGGLVRPPVADGLPALVGGPARGIHCGAGALVPFPRPDFGDPFGERNFELCLGLGAVVEIGDRHTRQAPRDRPLDIAQVAFFFRRHEREGIAGRLGAAGAADAVDVILRNQRHVEIDDMAERIDVDTARRDVGRDEDREPPALEPFQRRRALRLRAVAVDAFGADAGLDQVIGESIGAMLRARENERLLHVAALQQRHEQHRFEPLRHGIDGLGDARRRRRLALTLDRAGLRSISPVSAAIGGGIVALKNSVCRFAGT